MERALLSPVELDARYADAADALVLGASPKGFAVWAPTADNVAVCVYDGPRSAATGLHALQFDLRTGAWHASIPVRENTYYVYLVDVGVPGTGLVRQRVTDPYSVALAANGTRSLFVDLDSPATKPEGWDPKSTPKRIEAPTDLVVYELHVRDFSRDDATVPAAHRGKYLAFTDSESNGMRHLRALADAGVTDIHLLPVFDFATVPEVGCDPAGDKAHDCFNWGYDPVHFNAPEGSYASSADGNARIVEFRRMVQALHAANLRVGMDVVYNHTMAAGQAQWSVLDRIVPGYYHRYNDDGTLATSTCCANTATERRMMAKLMRDSVVLWATQYGIDSFRFDLMGHQPRAAMEDLQRALKAATGRDIPLIGEGWNFGEVADGNRFVQASQLSLAGSGIATFSDRARDAVRGGGPGDAMPALVDRKGWISGGATQGNADLVRIGLAGTLRDYVLDGRTLSSLDYNGQPAGYASQPGEVVNYVENHDNRTLYDIGLLKLPKDTPPGERARVQLLGTATTAFSQGIAYFHAGIDVLRSKSLDGNSFDSGDTANRLDWTYRDNGSGARPQDTAFMRDAFRDLLRIRASSTLFRLRTREDVMQRLTLPQTGTPEVIAGRLDGKGLAGARFPAVQYFLNASTAVRTLTLPASAGEPWVLHPVHLSPTAADARARDAKFDRTTGAFTIPPRTAVVFVQSESATLPDLLTFRLPARLSTDEDITVDVQLPEGYDAGHHYPVLYLDDGQDLADVHVRDTLEKVRSELAPFIVVAIHMPRDRMAGYGLADRVAGRSVVSPTKYGPVGANAHAYSEWVVRTLVPYVDAHWSTRADANGRAILGWSLGGINAFSLGWNYPEVFGRIGAFSPSFWLADAQDRRIAQELVRSSPAKPGLRAYFALGTKEEEGDRDKDGVIDVIDDANELATLLRERGGNDVVVVELPGGIHRQSSWAVMLPGFLRWAFPRR
ncbi:alpha-1,6-glucosidase domain-containing protein [Noviluteimonas dokdonensis]|uniref:alpha-1,6-glucosidase domain-containing protein n=1 Tax=Noviluteimonas dokdonensis TaxID=414050 RepID=UPI001F243B79|nr:alpha-1,6-glucosidase domain-containing protein [Lysobacter dokdonensis]